ncbi:MAG: NAD-dependent epimerase/dehydratase family protein [Gemmatimonadota bacterium]
MNPSRRTFLRASLGAGAALSLGHVEALKGSDGEGGSTVAPASRALKILILGGTGFIGPHQVRYALARGHSVTLFNRGSNPGMFAPSVEELVGDRAYDLEALRGREWDVVVDNSATLPGWVRDTAQLLEGSVGRYLFVSTISVYARNDIPGADETAEVRAFDQGDPLEVTEASDATYGALKAAAEREALQVFPGRTLIVRPGLIVGPGDDTDRFTYWPARVHRGGEVLAPGAPHDPVQFIDVRDLTHWMIRLLEEEATGTFNATGPHYPMHFLQMLSGVRAVTPAPVRFTWVDRGFLEERGVRPWSDLPVWIPPEGATAAFMRRNISRALAAGLTFRPLAETARDTLDWWLAESEGRRTNPSAGLSLESEQEVLAAWHRTRREGSA